MAIEIIIASIAAVAPTIAAVAAWREVRSPNGQRTGQAVHNLKALLEAHTVLDEARFREIKVMLREQGGTIS